MSKYDALWESIRERGVALPVPPSFDAVEELAGVPLDHSFLSCKKELTAYGYAVGRISMKNRTVLFIKSEEVTSTEPADCSEVRNSDLQDENSKKRPLRVVYLSPQGDVFNQKMAEEMAQEEDLVLLCGHYEGIDERVLEEIVTDYVSIGDYVLTGGELPAMVMIDTISRLVPGVLHNDVSAEFESFQDNLLEYPQYSRPEEWRGKKVPPILLSGHHANIEKWRREQSILRTMERRPDLLKESNLTDKEKKWIRQVKRERKEAEKIK